MTIWAARVARIITNIVALRSQSGRTTMRSITTPAKATTTIASKAEGISGTCCCISTWVIMPPIITKAPWAKFTMPLAL